VVIVLALNLKFAVSNPAEDNVFLRAIKIRSTTSFGLAVKPSAPCGKILRNVKNPSGIWQEYFAVKVKGHFSPKFSMLSY
jgi:hypothetical protein